MLQQRSGASASVQSLVLVAVSAGYESAVVEFCLDFAPVLVSHFLWIWGLQFAIAGYCLDLGNLLPSSPDLN